MSFSDVQVGLEDVLGSIAVDVGETPVADDPVALPLRGLGEARILK